jgi:hypothetical protein
MIPDSTIVASCLFVDVGTTYHAYAYLQATKGGEIRVAKTWYVRHRRAWLWDTLLLLEEHAGRFYVESITGREIRGELFKGRDPAQLFETVKLEGRIQEAAETRGVEPVEVQARDWRTAFLGPVIMGLRAPLDPVIAYVVKALFRDGGLPKPTEAQGAEPETHILDAVAGGMVCMARQLKVKLTLPRWILDGAYKVALEEKAKRDERRTAKKLGIALPGARRRLSREQQKQANVKRKATIAANKKVTAR